MIKHNPIHCLLIALAVAIGPDSYAAQAPTEDGLWYYEIGGAEPVSVPANPAVVSTTLGGSAQLGLGYSCGKFDPVAAVTNTLNDIGSGVDNMMNAMTAGLRMYRYGGLEMGPGTPERNRSGRGPCLCCLRLERVRSGTCAPLELR